MIVERLKSGVITVGHGRGFVVEGAGERLVITAAHCLPSLPLAGPSFGIEARTYGPLLAPRGEAPRGRASEDGLLLEELLEESDVAGQRRVERELLLGALAGLSSHRPAQPRFLDQLGQLPVF